MRGDPGLGLLVDPGPPPKERTHDPRGLARRQLHRGDVRVGDHPKALGSLAYPRQKWLCPSTRKYRRSTRISKPILKPTRRGVDPAWSSSLVAQQVSFLGEWNRRPLCAFAGSRRGSHVCVRGVPRRCRRGVTLDGISSENMKATERAVPAFSRISRRGCEQGGQRIFQRPALVLRHRGTAADR
jgi:hypothetical protein